MVLGRVGRTSMAPVLLVNLVVHLIVVGLAGWSLDKYIDGQQNHPHLGRNTSTSINLRDDASTGMAARKPRCSSFFGRYFLGYYCPGFRFCVQGGRIRGTQRKKIANSGTFRCDIIVQSIVVLGATECWDVQEKKWTNCYLSSVSDSQALFCV